MPISLPIINDPGQNPIVSMLTKALHVTHIVTLCKNLFCDNEDKKDDAQVAILTEVLHVTHIVTLCKNLVLLDAIPPTNMGIKWVVKVMKYYNIILNKNKRCYLPFHMCKYKPPST
jgi:hypothetical protein